MSETSRKFIIAGNWKMYKTVDEAYHFTRNLYDLTKDDVTQVEVVLCPPAISLERVTHTLEKELGQAPFAVGAQNMESHDEGAYTGEISPTMLIGIGVKFVIIGHSERRQYYNETDESVNAKVKTALSHQLTPIICVGESLEQRESGVTDSHVQSQVQAALNGIDSRDFSKLVFAYEPIWAIGTGKVCDASEANRVCGLIRATLAQTGDASQTRILYGGSVKPENSLELLGHEDIDGALVGGASLKEESFAQIIHHAVECSNANSNTVPA